MTVAQGSELDTRHGVILYLEDICVSFDGFRALHDLSLYIGSGELRCLIGPNGAGKTTLMDVITGKTRPDSGTAWFGQRVNLLTRSEPEIARLGIGRKFQRPTVCEALSVEDNIALAQKRPRGVWRTLLHRSSAEERDRMHAVLDLVGLLAERRRPAALLSHGQKQWLELGMLLAQDPQLLLVDEPVAGMTQQETERTAELLMSLAGERSIVVVEHDMEFVRSIARTVTVLHEGTVLAEGTMAEVQGDPRVVQVYLGE